MMDSAGLNLRDYQIKAINKATEAVVTVNSATLSAGFYAVFGMYILVILWSILTKMLIATPIQTTKKHRRKKPMKRLSAVFNR